MSSVFDMLASLANTVRRLASAYAFPVPAVIALFPGPHGSVERHIICDLALCRMEFTVVLLEGKGAPFCHTECGTVKGLVPVCTYIGRLLKMHPSNPGSAGIIDSMMAELFEFVRDTCPMRSEEHTSFSVAVACDRLSRHLDGDETYLMGYDRATTADVCWAAALEWSRREGHFANVKSSPVLIDWLERTGKYVDEDPASDQESVSD